MTTSILEWPRSVINYLNSLFFYLNIIGITSMGDVGPIQAKEKKRRAKCYLCKFFHEMTGISNFALSFAYRERFGDYENSFIFQSELDHKMDKKLRVAEIAARTGLSASTVSRVLAGKANTSDKARRAVLECARELGVMQGLAAGRLLLNNLLVFARSAPSMSGRISSTTG